MKFSIFKNKDIFIALFGILKNTSSNISLYFEKDRIHLQGMDKSHVCLFDGYLHREWFDIYDKNTDNIENICIDTSIFYTIISSSHVDHTIYLNYDIKADILQIDLLSKDNFNKYFKIPLVNIDYDLINIPTVDYDTDFSILAKKLLEITSQMINFGNDINIQCSEEQINLTTSGINGEMMVNIPIDDLNEYSICEGEVINNTYSLHYIHKMCISSKLCNQIEFSISTTFPMKIKYDLGNNSSLMFFMAPKVMD